MDDKLLEDLKANLFPASWAAIEDWDKFLMAWNTDGTRHLCSTFIPGADC